MELLILAGIGGYMYGNRKKNKLKKTKSIPPLNQPYGQISASSNLASYGNANASRTMSNIKPLGSFTPHLKKNISDLTHGTKHDCTLYKSDKKRQTVCRHRRKIDHTSLRLLIGKISQCYVGNSKSQSISENYAKEFIAKNSAGQQTLDCHSVKLILGSLEQPIYYFHLADRDNSGLIDQNEMHTVYQNMGYRFSPQFFSVLFTPGNSQMLNYSSNTYSMKPQITFDKFIKVYLAISTVTDYFKVFDYNRDGKAVFDDNSVMEIISLIGNV